MLDSLHGKSAVQDVELEVIGAEISDDVFARLPLPRQALLPPDCYSTLV